MSNTVTQRFSWLNDIEGWVDDGVSGNLNWTGDAGVPKGCIVVIPPVASPNSLTYCQYSGSWESLGVPPQSLVTQIKLDSGYNLGFGTKTTNDPDPSSQVKRVVVTNGQQSLGPYELWGNNQKQLQLAGSRIADNEETTWSGVSSNLLDVPAQIGKSNSIISLRIYSQIRNGGKNYFDETQYTFTYIPDPNPSGGNPVNSFTSSSTPFVIFGEKGTSNKSCSMYIGNSSNTNKPMGLNLFIKQSTSVSNKNDSKPLYISGSSGTPISAKQPNLFIKGYVNKTQTNFNLFLANNNAQGSASLFVQGSEVPLLTYKNLSPLFINGNDSYSQIGPSLVICQNNTMADSKNNPCQLFIKGPAPYNTGNMPLKGAALFIKSLPSYVAGTGINKSSYLYINAGDRLCETMNLFIKVDNAKITNAFSPLLINGSQKQGNFSTVPLFINGQAMSESMGLVIKGIDNGGTSRTMKMFIQGGNLGYSSGSPLYLCNNIAPNTNDMGLYIDGDGQNAGYYPYGESLGMYIERGPNAGITMFIENKNVQSGCSLFIAGQPAIAKQSPLFIQGFGGKTNYSSPAFIKGDIFREVNSVSTLVIPNVVGFTPKTAYLYTNGFEY